MTIHVSIDSILEGEEELLHKLIILDNPVQLAFEWKYFESWEKFRKTLPLDRKDIKENVSRWMTGQKVPAMKNLLEIVEMFCSRHAEERDVIYKVFFCAKIIHNIIQYPQVLAELRNIDKCDIITPGEYFGEPLERTLHNNSDKQSRHENQKRFDVYYELYVEVGNELYNNLHKHEDKNKLDEKLKKLEKITNDLQGVYICWWNTQRLRACWYVLSGEWESAKKCYEEITDIIFYTGEENSERILKEALVLASIKEDRPFLKKLKHRGVVFGLFGTPYTNGFNFKYSQANNESRTKDFVVEDSEVKGWASSFYKIFAEDRFFISKDNLPKSIENIFPLVYVEGDMPRTADIKNKNKIIDLKGIKYPQLVWFTFDGNIQAVKELLNAKADINKLSSSSESALLLSITRMDMTLCSDDQGNIEYFEMLSKIEHSKKTLEILTNKKHLSVLGSAVETWNPQIVNKVLEMMQQVKANVDIKYGGDKITPLYSAINLFAAGDRLLNQQHEILPDTFEYMRRIGALPGITTADVKQNYAEIMKDPIFTQTYMLASQFFGDSYKQCYKKENLLEIIEALLKAGCNPNEPHYLHDRALKDYTPLMIATELDWVDAFGLLIKYGGDVNKQCKFVHTRTGEVKTLNCWWLALAEKSNNVLKYMQKNCKNDGKIVTY